MKFLIICCVFTILVSTFSCKENPYAPYKSDIDPSTWDSCNNTVFTFEDISIQSLTYAELPYTQSKILADDILTRERIYDEDSIPILFIKEKKV